jgi:adenine-specific DNA methylase
MQMKKGAYQPDKKLVAVCGLFCPACGIFIAQRESLEKRSKMAKNLQIPVEGLKCDGCRAEKRFAYCETCKMTACAQEKGLDFCAECEEYPCTALKEFQAAMPHRIELWQAQVRIKEVGYEKWFEEMLEHYSCAQCGMINSAYHLACRQCGAIPSCAYVDLHKAEIISYLSNKRESTNG